jgi:hypothetical protein
VSFTGKYRNRQGVELEITGVSMARNIMGRTRKEPIMSKCIPCTDPKATVKASDNIPLCGTHWNYWLAKYDPMFGEEPPCGAHLVRDVPSAAV